MRHDLLRLPALCGAFALALGLVLASCSVPVEGVLSPGDPGAGSTGPASGATPAAQAGGRASPSPVATGTGATTGRTRADHQSGTGAGEVHTSTEVSDALDRTALDGVALVHLDAEGDASWRATGDEDLPPDVVERDHCGSLIWMPRTLGAIRGHLPMEVRTLPQSADPSEADIKGVIAVTAPRVQDAVDRFDRLVELAGQCPTYTVAIGGSSPTDLTVTEVPLRGTDRAVDLVGSRQGETLEREVHVIARVDNVLVTLTRPVDDTIRAHRLVAAITAQLRSVG